MKQQFLFFKITFQILIIVTLVLTGTYASILSTALADVRFQSDYPCSNTVKKCNHGTSDKKRVIEGFEVEKECWDYHYTKTCNYPSKNDCRLYEHCYAIANHECLLKDSLGNCVNQEREFSCKYWETFTKENKTIRTDLVAKDGHEGLICKGVPCIDGNCVDKSYQTNGEMMDSVAKLHAASNMKPDQNHNFNLFAGSKRKCNDVIGNIANCCKKKQGWGVSVGIAKCTKDEKNLSDLRDKKLCVSVGTKKHHALVGAKSSTDRHFCCFGNLLEKTIQVQGRKQPALRGKFSGPDGFGSGSSPDCRGLTIDEIKMIDFSQIDFKEFIDEITLKFNGTYKAPNPEEIKATIENHTKDINKYDDDEYNPANKYNGVNNKMTDVNKGSH